MISKKWKSSGLNNQLLSSLFFCSRPSLSLVYTSRKLRPPCSVTSRPKNLSSYPTTPIPHLILRPQSGCGSSSRALASESDWSLRRRRVCVVCVFSKCVPRSAPGLRYRSLTLRENSLRTSSHRTTFDSLSLLSGRALLFRAHALSLRLSASAPLCLLQPRKNQTDKSPASNPHGFSAGCPVCSLAYRLRFTPAKRSLARRGKTKPQKTKTQKKVKYYSCLPQK